MARRGVILSAFQSPRLSLLVSEDFHRGATPHVDTQLIREIVSYVSAHQGPDSEGRAHSKLKKLPLAEVEAAIQILQSQGDVPWLRPYHLSPVPAGCWQDPRLIDELLKRQCEALVREKYGGDLVRLCCEVEVKELRAPLKEIHAGREILVSTSIFDKAFDGSPFRMVQRYISTLGKEDQFAWFKSYHMAKAPRRTWHDQALRDDVIKRKCDSLLREHFRGDLTSFCCEVTAAQLLSPLVETHAGRDIPISMDGAIGKLRDSPYEVVRRYLHIIGKEGEFDWFRPYHMTTSPLGVWKSRAVVDELILKQCNALVHKMFGDDLTRFCCEVAKEDILSPLKEIHGGREIAVSMGALANSTGNSLHSIVKRYLEIIGKSDEYSWLRPYHLAHTSKNTWTQQAIVDEVLKKKCNQLLHERFGGDLIRFCCEVTREDLLTPLRETHAGREFSISMGGLANKLRDSSYGMINRYLHLIGRQEEFAWLEPYHLASAPQRTWQDQSVLDTVIRKKCEALLRENFGGSLIRLCMEVTQKHLMVPLVESHGGKEIVISVSAAMNSFGGPYGIIKRYFKLIKHPFPYSRDCFIGSSMTRWRRQSGELSALDLKRIKRLDGSFDTERYGFRNFSAPDKTAVREFMIEMVENELQDRSVNYLGLETEQLRSLRALYDRVNLSPEDSLVVEQDSRIFSAMKSSVQRLPNREKRVLRNVEIRRNALERELALLPKNSFEFNVVNLDYLGHISQGKELAFQLLLSRYLLAPQALVFITLHDSELARARAQDIGYGRDQAKAVESIFTRLADVTGHQTQRVAWLTYEGGSSGRSGSRMLWLAYKLTRQGNNGGAPVERGEK